MLADCLGRNRAHSSAKSPICEARLLEGSFRVPAANARSPKRTRVTPRTNPFIDRNNGQSCRETVCATVRNGRDTRNKPSIFRTQSMIDQFHQSVLAIAECWLNAKNVGSAERLARTTTSKPFSHWNKS